MTQPDNKNYHLISNPTNYRLGWGSWSCANNGMIISAFKLCYNDNLLGSQYEFTVYDWWLY